MINSYGLGFDLELLRFKVTCKQLICVAALPGRLRVHKLWVHNHEMNFQEHFVINQGRLVAMIGLQH